MALLRHLALRCKDMERSRKFYEEVIGWTFVEYRQHGGGLDLSDGVNNITLIQQPANLDRPLLEEGNEYIHFGVIVDELEDVWGKLQKWGTELSRENVKERNPIDPAEGPPDSLSFKVLDPDGNVIDITSKKDEWVGVTV